MLKELAIQNFALIDSIKVEFERGLTVITGETGAGKSILLGALGLILGNRADHSAFKDLSKKCIVEGVFDIKGYGLSTLFEKYDLDYAEETIVRKEISSSGKSRSFINDTPVNLETLKHLGSFLVDIHSQQQSALINDTSFQLMILDVIAGNQDLVKKYVASYKQLRKLSSQLINAKSQYQKNKEKEDFLKFQYSELEELNYTLGEAIKLESEQNKLSNSESIIKNLQQASYLASNDETNLRDLSMHLVKLLSEIQEFDTKYEELASRLKSVQLEMEDIAEEIESTSEEFEFDQERQIYVEERLGEIFRLQSKHNLTSPDNLVELQLKLEQDLLNIDHAEGNLDKLRSELNNVELETRRLAAQLSDSRRKVISFIQDKTESTLSKLGIPDARFIIESKTSGDLSSHGVDNFQFLFSANKGIEPSLISKTASGGEISRLMLAIKSMLAEYQNLPTILFDEIDTGVSGKVAEQMGEILRTSSEKRQIISITHLPQLASKGDQHLYVFKETDDNKSYTTIKKLDYEGRVHEIANMLSGSAMTEAAINNAKQLLSHK